MGKLNLLILNGDLPIFPGWGGVEYLQTTGLARLAQRVGLVSLVHTAEQRARKAALADAGIALYLWENPYIDGLPPADRDRAGPVPRALQVIDGFAQTWPRRPRDTAAHDFQFTNISGPLVKALNDGSWHALIVVQSQCATWLDYVPRFPVSVLVMHDIRGLLCERRARVAESLRERTMWRAEASIYRRFERRYCQEYDLVVTVSPADEVWVREHYRPRSIVTIPIPVDSNYFASVREVKEAEARIVFTGMMNHPPNVDAACFFAHQVFPQIRAANQQAEFWIVGREPSNRVRALASLPGVVVTGFVPDIRPYLAQATVVVVPLRFGSGMRQKILEAWAMQKCVVSTRMGAEGLNYQDGVNILIADDRETMAERVAQASSDPALRHRIGAQAREVVITRHEPGRLAETYLEEISARVQQKRRQDDPMDVLIDLRWMRAGFAGGIENLSRSFLKHLVRLDAFNLYTMLVPPELRYEIDLRERSNFRIALADGPRLDWQRLRWHAARFSRRLVRVPYWRSEDVETLRRMRDLSNDVVLSLSGYISTDMYPFTNVLVVPDLQHEYYPQFFEPQALEERKWVFRDSVARAAHVIAVSEHTRQSVIDRLGVAPSRITTVHLAADPIFEPRHRSHLDKDGVLRKYGLAGADYLLFPANTWPHKNHQAAIEALQILGDEYRLCPLLVLTGAAKEAHPHVMELTNHAGLQDRVRFLGYCPTEDMPPLYEGASALVFPSLFEGFGIPLLEAMWCDCPIVCSNVTSLPEIARDAALLIDPHSPRELAAALDRVLTDEELRSTLIQRGRRRVQDFSWFSFSLGIIRILHETAQLRLGG